MVANILLGLSGTIFILAIAEILLSQAQKARIEAITHSAWNFLDELTRLSFLNWLRRRRVQRAVSLLAAVLMLVPYFQAGGFGGFPLLVTLAIFGTSALTLLGGPYLIAFSAHGSSALRVFVRTVVAIIAVMAVVFVVLISAVAMTPPAEFDVDMNDSSKEFSSPRLAFITMAFILLSVLPLLLCLLIVVPLLAIVVARVLLRIFEFFVRRIAEYPKGPIVAISGLVGATIAAIKAFH